MELNRTIAFVTGGASGLGRATAARIVEAGGSVALLDRPGAPGGEVAAELGPRARFVPADVTDASAVDGALEETVRELGGLNAIVNCAGIGTAHRVVDKTGSPFPLDLFSLTIQVNLIGTFNVIRLAVVRMVKNEPFATGERGVIVNTASVAAFDGQIGQAAYSASKGGVVAMTLPIARDLASFGIRVLTIAPGTFETPMMAAGGDALKEKLGAQIPFPKRLGDPAEFAGLVAHIVENPYLNGETIRLDGAIRMAPR